MLVGTVPLSIHIRVREFDDEEKDAHKDQEEASGRKEVEETLKINMYNLS